jgi:hypothetical protein
MNGETNVDEALATKMRQRAEEMAKQYLSDMALEVDNEQFELFVQEALNIISGIKEGVNDNSEHE